MKIIIFLTFILTIASCASSRARKNIAHGEIIINGGVYNNKEWSDKLVLKRTSWYQEATMEYDLVMHKLTDDSKFASWMGPDRKYLKECKEFYISLAYADLSASNPVSFIVNQIEQRGLTRKSVRSFQDNLKAHDNYSDWRLGKYKVFGFCRPIDSNGPVVISVPGFKSITL